jgi:hypothetical protein
VFPSQPLKNYTNLYRKGLNSGLGIGMNDWVDMLGDEFSGDDLLQRIAEKCNSNVVRKIAPPVIAEKLGWALPGFGAGARVSTSFGHVPVEALRRRDEIRTTEGRFLRVQYIDTVRLDRRFLLTHPDAHPVVIHKNGFGPSIPSQTILVSGCQKIRSPKRFDQTSGRNAEDFVGQNNIMRKYHGYFTYYVFHCGQPCTASVDGLWVDLDPDALRPREE